MKRIIFSIAFLFTASLIYAQVSPSNLNAPANSQPVPNSFKSDRSQPAPKPPVTVPSTYIPPIYPGAEVRPVETQRELVFPASPPAPTQPVQRESKRPVEATNNLNPTQPPRDEASRNNQPVQVNP